MPHYPSWYRPMAPNPITFATCSACLNYFPTNDPDTGCLSIHSIHPTVQVVATKCERCLRRDVDSTTVGAVNKRNG